MVRVAVGAWVYGLVRFSMRPSGEQACRQGFKRWALPLFGDDTMKRYPLGVATGHGPQQKAHRGYFLLIEQHLTVGTPSGVMIISLSN